MKTEGKVITILLADDDPDDRKLTQDAFAENRLANILHCVEDGEELMDYLHRRGQYDKLRGQALPGCGVRVTGFHPLHRGLRHHQGHPA